jgi:hypothetical protein
MIVSPIIGVIFISDLLHSKQSLTWFMIFWHSIFILYLVASNHYALWPFFCLNCLCNTICIQHTLCMSFSFYFLHINFHTVLILFFNLYSDLPELSLFPCLYPTHNMVDCFIDSFHLLIHLSHYKLGAVAWSCTDPQRTHLGSFLFHLIYNHCYFILVPCSISLLNILT